MPTFMVPSFTTTTGFNPPNPARIIPVSTETFETNNGTFTKNVWEKGIPSTVTKKIFYAVPKKEPTEKTVFYKKRFNVIKGNKPYKSTVSFPFEDNQLEEVSRHQKNKRIKHTPVSAEILLLSLRS